MSTNYIDQITDTAGTTYDVSEGDSTRIFRATCSTAASTAAKVATLQTSNRNFSLATGVRVAVTFTYGNSAATPTLRVDGSSTGTAKTIAVASSATAKTTGNGTTYNTWGPYETIIFTYDGTYWVNGGSSLGIYNAYNQAASAGTGTVTSVGIANATNGGLTVSGSPITTNGTINVGHTNILTNAQTTQAVYPITIDKNGHISGYGSAVSIPTAYTLPVATYNVLGGVKPWKSYTASSTGPTAATASTAVSVNTITNTVSRYYAVEMDKDGRMFVNVPWENTTYTIPSITLNGSTTTSPSFYAPTSAGTSGQYLKSNGSGAPTWSTIPDYTVAGNSAGTAGLVPAPPIGNITLLTSKTGWSIPYLQVTEFNNHPTYLLELYKNTTYNTIWTLNIDNATNLLDGLMSSTDKAKVDAIETTYLPLTGGTLTGNLSLSADSGVGRWVVTKQNNSTIMSSGVSTSGVHGLFSDKGSRWMIQASADGSSITINEGTSSNTYVAGSLTVMGHDSPIGTVLNIQNDTSTVIPSGTSTPLMTFQLPYGVWEINATIRFPVMGTDHSKYVYANISDISGSTSLLYRAMAENGITTANFSHILQPSSSNNTYYVNVYHNSGSDKTFATGSSVAQHIHAVRIA